MLLIGENPHKTENKKRVPFVGPSGKDLDGQYLMRVGIPRYTLGVTNAMACSLPRFRNPTPKEAAICAAHNLPAQLDAFDADIIVLMGSVACSLAYPPIDLELQHGIPFVGRVLRDWGGVIIPMYHPAAGLHQSSMMIQLQRDFPVLAAALNDGLYSHPVVDNVPRDYRVIESVRELEADLRDQGGSSGKDRSSAAIDTEVDCQGFDLDPLNDPPWMLSYSIGPGHGRVVRAKDHAILRAFHGYVQEVRPEVIMHNSLFDRPVLIRMGVEVPWKRIHDTMESAYLTGYMAQGLKAIGYRLLGVKMKDYLDLVTPPSQLRQARYMAKLMQTKGIEQPWLKPRQWKITRKAARAFESWADNPAEVVLQDRWKGWHDDCEDDVRAVEAAVGRFPYRSIVYADQEEAAYYAAADADITRRAKGALIRELGKVRR